MNFDIKTIPKFDKQLKKLVKKYPSLKIDFISLVNSLEENPTQGTPLGNSCYKIRLAIKAKGKGKSSGARLISYVILENQTLFLLSIYDKSNIQNIYDNEIKELIQEVF